MDEIQKLKDKREQLLNEIKVNSIKLLSEILDIEDPKETDTCFLIKSSCLSCLECSLYQRCMFFSNVGENAIKVATKEKNRKDHEIVAAYVYQCADLYHAGIMVDPI